MYPSLSTYEAQQDLERFNTLINTKEILTKEEFDFCVAWDKETADKYLNFMHSSNTALNINVYSEAEHHQRIFEMECGI